MARYDNTANEFTCKKCKGIKPRGRFTFYRKKGYLCRFAKCKDCLNAEERKRKPKSSRRTTRIHPVITDPQTGTRTKQCPFCETIKPLSEFATASGKIYSFCNPCRLAYKRAYRKGIRLARPDVAQRRCARCGATMPVSEFAIKRNICRECVSHKSQERWQAMPKGQSQDVVSRRRAAARNWVARNRERCLEAGRLYRKRFPEKHCEIENRRRARKANAPQVEKIDRVAIIKRDKGICYICGKRPSKGTLTLDHVVPLARGGAHTAINLKVACRSCNASKHTKLPSEIRTYQPLLV